MPPNNSLRKTATVAAVILIFCIAAWQKNHPGTGTTSADVRDVALPTAAQPGGHDLQHDEELGGHTLQRHVGRTDAQLRERLERERDISAASTYADRAAAQRTVAAALAQNASRITQWLDRLGEHPNLALQFHGSDAAGRSLRRGSERAETCYDAAVVLRWDGGRNYHVLTSYPEAQRGR